MIYLVLGILLSSVMTVCFKLSDRHNVDGNHMILVNYIVAAVVSTVMAVQEGLFQDYIAILGQAQLFRVLIEKNLPNTYLLLTLLGIISGFYFIIDLINIKNSIRYNGAGVSNLFSKFGFLLTTAFAMVAWAEIPSGLQLWGIPLAVVAFIIATGRMGAEGNVGKPFLLFQLVLFAGLAEINNKAAVYYAVSRNYNSLYISIIFSMALVLAFLYTGAISRREGRPLRLTGKEIVGGICTGLPNVVSNYFILKALESIPSNVYFPTSAAGNLIFTTLLSALVFKERLTKRQWAAIGIMAVSLTLTNI